MAITDWGGKPGGKGQTMDYTIVHGLTVSKYRCETIGYMFEGFKF